MVEKVVPNAEKAGTTTAPDAAIGHVSSTAQQRTGLLLSGEMSVEKFQALFPSLPIKTVTFAGEGKDNKAYLVNGTHIFRIPLDEKKEKLLRVELRILELLKKKGAEKGWKLPVPNYEYVREGTTADERLTVGCQAFTGQLSKQNYALLPNGQKRNVLKDTASFL